MKSLLKIMPYVGVLFILLLGCTQSKCSSNNLDFCSIQEIKELLEVVIDHDIQLITSSRPPDGNRSNISGKLVSVNDYTIELLLINEYEGREIYGVYQIKDIIGFEIINDKVILEIMSKE